jgi:hypothetical protein
MIAVSGRRYGCISLLSVRRGGKWVKNFAIGGGRACADAASSSQARIVDIWFVILLQQLDALKKQKKGLMQKLVTGEVRVKLPKGVA